MTDLEIDQSLIKNAKMFKNASLVLPIGIYCRFTPVTVKKLLLYV